MSGWPWPLDAVQGWFDGLWKWIGEAASGAVSAVSGWINDAVSGLRTWVNGAVGWIWDQVKPVFGPIVDWTSSLVKSFWEGLQAFVKDPVGFLGSAISSITTTIGRGLSDVGSWLYTQISSGLAAAGEALSSIGSTISKMLGDAAAAIGKTLGDIGSFVSTTIWGWVDGALRWATDSFKWLNDQLSSVGSNIINAVGSYVGGAVEAISSGFGAVFGPVVEGATSFFNAIGSLVTAFDPSKILSDVMATIQKIWETITLAFSAKSVRKPEEADAIAWGVVTQVSAAWMTQSIALIVAEAASVGQLDVTLQGLGQTPQLQAGLKMVQEIYSTITEISLLIPLRQFYNRAFTPNIPPAPDLVRMVVREAFEAKMVIEAPAIFTEYMEFSGYAKEWSDRYWTAHFEPIALPQAYANLWRGLWTKEQFMYALHIADVHPMWREDIFNVAYRPMSRYELRYGWQSGIVSEEKMISAFRAMGESPEDAEISAKSQIAYMMRADLTALITEWSNDFVEGFLDESTFRANMAAINVLEARQDFYVSRATISRERKQRRGLLAIYSDAYTKDLITDGELAARADELIVDDDARDNYVNQAYVNKYKKPAPPKPPTVDKALEELHKYQISYAVEAFRKYAIEKPELIELLVAADVDPLVAATRADYEELKRPLPKPTSAEIARAKETLRIQGLGEKTAIEEFRDGTIDASQLFSRLQELGYSDALASAVTQFEIVKAYKPGAAA